MHNPHDPRVLPPKNGVRPSCLVIPNAGQMHAHLAQLAQRWHSHTQPPKQPSSPDRSFGLFQPGCLHTDADASTACAEATTTPCAPPPPTQSHHSPATVAWPRTTLDYLCLRIPAVGRADWLRRMAEREVVAETGQVITAHTPVLHGLRIYYYRAVDAEPPMPFESRVLFEDAHIVVADKPHFLPVTPCGRLIEGTLLVQLQRKLELETLSPVHRIDRDTAGIVIFAKHRHERGAYQALFRERQVDKAYEAIAPYRADLFENLQTPLQRASHIAPSGHFIRMHEVAHRAPNAWTEIRLIEHNAAWARYALRPTTGQRHQLRVHMAALGLGLWGDGLYPQVADMPEGDFSRPLQLLARSIAFTDPITGEPRRFESQRQLRQLWEMNKEKQTT